MLFANLLLTFTSIVVVILCLLIFVSNTRRRVNQILAIFIFNLFLWLVTNLLTNISSSPDISLLFAQTTLIGATLVPYFFWLFCEVYSGRDPSNRLMLLMALIPLIILSTTPTTLNIISVDAYGANTKIGLIYYLLIAEYLFYFFAGLRRLYYFYFEKSTDVIQKTQLRYIFTGVILTLIPGVTANAILPVLGYDDSIFYGPNAVIFLALFMSIAIVRHRLLDMRLIVARSLAYVLLLASLVSVYIVAIFVITQSITGSDDLSVLLKNALPLIAALSLSLFYHPLKRFFDSLTNRVFYRDAYDTKELLDEFNQTIVSTIELESLLDKSAVTINKYLKPEYCAFALLNEDGSIRVLHAKGSNIATQLIEQVRGYVHASKKKVILTDLLEADSNDLKLLLQSAEIGALVRVTKSSKSEGLGYILMGYKKSGTIYTPQDIGAMETVANELVIAIENALQYEEIQNFAKTLQAKVDDATRDLRKANEKLKALDQTKDDFISMASHQLRTPLTSVKGYVSMVLEGDAGKVSTKQKELLDQAFVSSQRMVYLIADLLNVSRLRTGKFVIEAKKTNLADVVEGEMAQLIETAKGKGLELTYHKPTKFPELMLDETKIRQVIMNFSDNAIHYTPSGGHVSVNLEDRGDTIEFTVVDDGLGVPKAEQHHLFNKFYRASNAKKARPDGTGLGLFMAKKVIIAQGGAIIFKTQEGKGSTFGFSFTKKPLLPEHYKGAVSANTESVTDKT